MPLGDKLANGELPEIEMYTDYCRFLKVSYHSAKKLRGYFSYRYFNRKAGISSPTLYSQVVAGERNLTEKTMQDFVKGPALFQLAGQFFMALHRFNQTKTGDSAFQKNSRS